MRTIQTVALFSLFACTAFAAQAAQLAPAAQAAQLAPANQGKISFGGSVAKASCTLTNQNQSVDFGKIATTAFGVAKDTVAAKRDFNIELTGCDLSGFKKPDGSESTYTNLSLKFADTVASPAQGYVGVKFGSDTTASTEVAIDLSVKGQDVAINGTTPVAISDITLDSVKNGSDLTAYTIPVSAALVNFAGQEVNQTGNFKAAVDFTIEYK